MVGNEGRLQAARASMEAIRINTRFRIISLYPVSEEGIARSGNGRLSGEQAGKASSYISRS
jgi:hypothetical protein